MQPHTGAIITLLAQLRYDLGKSYYKVDSEWNGKQYQITLHDVYRHQLLFRVGNIYPCYTKVHLEIGGDFSIESAWLAIVSCSFYICAESASLKSNILTQMSWKKSTNLSLTMMWFGFDVVSTTKKMGGELILRESMRLHIAEVNLRISFKQAADGLKKYTGI